MSHASTVPDVFGKLVPLSGLSNVNDLSAYVETDELSFGASSISSGFRNLQSDLL